MEPGCCQAGNSASSGGVEGRGWLFPLLAADAPAAAAASPEIGAV